MLPRPTVRLRLTALYTGLFVIAGGLLLAVSYGLLDRHLHRTLADAVAADVLAQVREQYVLSLVAVTLLALLLGWIAAGRALAPLRTIVAAARGVGGRSLDRRVGATGPDDELRELAETFDAMLERLEGAFESQRRFVANASHELRTPLTVMRTELEVALADPSTDEQELRRLARVLHDEVMRSQRLIESLLALARSEAGDVPRDERVNLAELATAVQARLGGLAAERDVRLRVEAEPAVLTGDRQLLERMTWNLAENAVLYNRRGGFARMAVSVEEGRATVRVSNSGAVVPVESIGLLLEPFQRLGRGAGQGAGVGLSLVRAVAEVHGGTVQLEPRDGGGIVAEVRLPMTPVRTGSARRPAGPSSARRRAGSPAPTARPARRT